MLQLQIIDDKALKQLKKFKKLVRDIEKINRGSLKIQERDLIQKHKTELFNQKQLAKEKETQQKHANALSLAQQKEVERRKTLAMKFEQAEQKKASSEKVRLAKKAASQVEKEEKKALASKARAEKQVIADKRVAERQAEARRNRDIKQKIADVKRLARERERADKKVDRERKAADRKRHQLEKQRIRERERLAKKINGFFANLGKNGTGSLSRLSATAATIAGSMFAARRGIQGISEGFKEMDQSSAFLRSIDISTLAKARQETFGIVSDQSLQKQLQASKVFGLSNNEAVGILKSAAALSRLDPSSDASGLADQLRDAIFRGSALRIDNNNSALSKFVPTLNKAVEGIDDAVERSRIFTKILTDPNGAIRKDFESTGVFEESLSTKVNSMLLSFSQMNTGVVKLISGFGLLSAAVLAVTARLAFVGASGVGSGVLGAVGGIGQGISGAASSLLSGGKLLKFLGPIGPIIKVATSILSGMVGAAVSFISAIAPFIAGSLGLVLFRAFSQFSPEGSDKSLSTLDRITVGGALLNKVAGGILSGKNSFTANDTEVANFKAVFGDSFQDVVNRILEVGVAIKAGVEAFLVPIDEMARKIFGQDIFKAEGAKLNRFVSGAERIGTSLGIITSSLAQAGLGALEGLVDVLKTAGDPQGPLMRFADVIVMILNGIGRAGIIGYRGDIGYNYKPDKSIFNHCYILPLYVLV